MNAKRRTFLVAAILVAVVLLCVASVMKDASPAPGGTASTNDSVKVDLDFTRMNATMRATYMYRLAAMPGEFEGKTIRVSGTFLTRAMSRALAVAGCNASMGKIVAAPTAGSCGILPGCLVSLYEDRGVSRDAVVLSMFTAGAFGMVIAQNASIAGAQGGCQAECGSAAGMAAASLVELMGGTPQQCADACAIALVNQMGLVCDPVAGLVEIPCIKRNAAGVMTAFSAADMALAGIRPYIPADECIAAMRAVGDALPASLKETAAGGLAATPTGRALREQVFGAAETVE